MPGIADAAKQLAARAQRGGALPLLYIEFDDDPGAGDRAGKQRRKRAIAAALKAALGTILRSEDIAAAGPGADWFVVLLVARARRRRSQIPDADLGVAAERLRRTAMRAIDAQAGSSVSVRAGWSVLELDGGPLAPALRQAVRGAAVVARVEERRATVLAAVSHELRTPLTAIVGFAERLQERQLDPAASARALAIIIEESHRLARLAEGLIDLGSWTSGHLHLRKRRCSLDELAARAATAVNARAVQRKVTVTIRGRERAALDPDRCLQVLINVLDNAVRHASARSRVEIVISSSRSGCTVAVANRGLAFPANVRRELGRPFTRGLDGKIGLGLAISKIIVEAHGGRLSLARHGGCNVVRVTLPRHVPVSKEFRRTEQVFVSNK